MSLLTNEGPDRDLEAAVRWSLSMSAQRTDSRELQHALQLWYQQEPAAAIRALEQPGIPQNVREDILKLHANSTAR